LGRFNTVFKKCIEENKINRNQFAKTSGVSREYLYKLTNRDIPTEETFQKVYNALPVSPTEKEELLKAYKISKDGEFLYNQRIQIKKLIDKMCAIQEHTANTPTQSRMSYDIQQNDKDIEVINGELPVNHTIDSILTQAVCCENPCVRFVMPYDYNFFFDNLYLKYTNNPDLKVECLFEFSKNTDIIKKKHNINLDIIQTLMPFIMTASGNFSAFYQYSLYPAKYVTTAPMPYFMITPNSVIAITADLQGAIILKNLDVIQFYNKLFDDMNHKGKPLIEQIATLKDSIEFYAQTAIKEISGISGFGSHPCISIYYDKEILNTHIPLEVPNREQVVEMTMTVCNGMRGYAKLGNNSAFFTLDGFESFVREGIIETIAEGFFNAFTPPKRAEIIKKMIKDTESGKMNYRVINTSNLKVPACFYADVFTDSHMNLVMGSPTNGGVISTIKIDEPSIVEAFRDFLVNSINTDFLYSKDDTLRVLNKALEEIGY
jgi:transcriptional regulator with XRE-family HTH domain